MATSVELITKYFPELNNKQKEQFSSLAKLYAQWNEQINVISRKDIDNIYERHVLHSLGIAKAIQFKPRTKVLDVGTGGGFPGIPLAILFPDVEFYLVDSIAKKIKVVTEISHALELQNLKAETLRAEKVQGQYDFVISRAVTAMPKFIAWMSGKFLKNGSNILPNGILYLKGGDLEEELKPITRKTIIYSLSDYFEEEFFETKKVVYVKW